MSPRKKVEVETSDAHDGIISVLLVRDDNFGSLVPHKGELVVGGTERLEEGRTGREERDILDIGVVFRLVCDEMVNIMATLPPAHG